MAKINSLRDSYRKEMKIVEEPNRSSAGTDELYQPHLWYYDLLLFTKDQEMPRKLPLLDRFIYFIFN